MLRRHRRFRADIRSLAQTAEARRVPEAKEARREVVGAKAVLPRPKMVDNGEKWSKIKIIAKWGL